MGFCFIFCDKCFHRERLSIIQTVDKMTRGCYYSWEIFFAESTAEELELMILVINVLQDWLPCVMFKEYETFLYVFESFYYATGLILFFFYPLQRNSNSYRFKIIFLYVSFSNALV